jgi:hypothetical protein
LLRFFKTLNATAIAIRNIFNGRAEHFNLTKRNREATWRIASDYNRIGAGDCSRIKLVEDNMICARVRLSKWNLVADGQFCDCASGDVAVSRG